MRADCGLLVRAGRVAFSMTAAGSNLQGLFDAHCHLQMFGQPDSAAVREQVEQARAAGVERAVVCATSCKDWEDVAALKRQVCCCEKISHLHDFISIAAMVSARHAR